MVEYNMSIGSYIIMSNHVKSFRIHQTTSAPLCKPLISDLNGTPQHVNPPMSQFKDFEGEFLAVKKYTLQELHSDKFVLRLNRERQLNKAAELKGEASNYPLPTSSDENDYNWRKRVLIAGTNDLKEQLERKQKMMRVIWLGTKALNEELEKKHEKKKVLLVGTKALCETLEKKKQEKKQEEKKQEEKNLFFMDTKAFNEVLEKKQKKQKVLLVGTKALNEELDKKQEVQNVWLEGTKALSEVLEKKQKGENAFLVDTKTLNGTLEKKRQIILKDKISTPQATLEEMKNTQSIKFIPIQFAGTLDPEDEFMDAYLQFHDLSGGSLEGFEPAENEVTTQMEIQSTDSEYGSLEFNDAFWEEATEALNVEIDLDMDKVNRVNYDSLKFASQLEALNFSIVDDENANHGNEKGKREYNENITNDFKESETTEDDKNYQNTISSNFAKFAWASDVALLKLIVKPQISGLSFPLLQQSSLSRAYKEVYSIIEHTIKDHEGQSTLLVGPRGSGKTFIAEKAISMLREKYQHLFIIIKLNALLHSDDKLALREIARQLDNHSRLVSGIEQSGTFEQRAISDTFTNILLTLDTNAPGRQNDEPKESSVPVVILIDEIEKFTGGGKQTLLYNLFDLSQSSKVPICVIGISTKITTRELLEKRVRSRFSQRIIPIQRAASLETFWENARLNLIVPPEEFSRFSDQSYPKHWNLWIDSMYRMPSGLKKVIYQVFYTTKNYRDVYHCCQLPFSSITENEPFPLPEKFEVYLKQLSPGYAQAIVGTLSNLELLLTIAAARWVEKSDVPQVNFNLAYKEYTAMMRRLNLEATTLSTNSSFFDSTVLAGIKVNQKIWSSKVLRDCWDNLYKMGLLFDVITSNNEVNVNNNFNMYKSMVIEDSKMLQIDITLEELGLLIDDLVSFKKLTRL